MAAGGGNRGVRDVWWDKVERFLIGLLGLAAMVVGLVQVVGRYVAPRYAISWAEEVIVYLVVWGIMLAASQLVRTDGHVRPDLVLRAVSPRVQRWMEVANCVIALAFCAGLAWYGSASSRRRGCWTSERVGRAVSDVALFGGDSDRRRADVRPLSDPALSLSLRLRSPDHDGRPYPRA